MALEDGGKQESDYTGAEQAHNTEHYQSALTMRSENTAVKKADTDRSEGQGDDTHELI